MENRSLHLPGLQGIDAFFPILREAVSLEAAMKRENAEANMEAAVEQAYRLWRL